MPPRRTCHLSPVHYRTSPTCSPTIGWVPSHPQNRPSSPPERRPLCVGRAPRVDGVECGGVSSPQCRTPEGEAEPPAPPPPGPRAPPVGGRFQYSTARASFSHVTPHSAHAGSCATCACTTPRSAPPHPLHHNESYRTHYGVNEAPKDNLTRASARPSPNDSRLCRTT